MANKANRAADAVELRSIVARVAASKGTARQRFNRLQAVLLANRSVLGTVGLPSGQKRAALTDAMIRAQRPAGKKYAKCILCGESVSAEVGKNHPASPRLIVLIPSAAIATDEFTGTDKSTAHRLGYVPGNVAVACNDCERWKASQGVAPVLTSKVLGERAASVLLSWDGIGNVVRSSTESDDERDSRKRRARAREHALARA